MSTVLSVIGTIFMILLVTVLFLLGVVCFILFCPFCYKTEVGFKEKLMAEGKVCWLLGIIWIRFSYNAGELRGTFRIFGIDVQKLSAWYRKRKERKIAKIKKKTKQKSNQEKNKQSDLRKESAEKETVQMKMPDKISVQKDAETDMLMQKTEKEPRKQKKSNWFVKFYRKIKALPQKGKVLWKNICSFKDKAKGKTDWAGAVRKLWKSENTHKLICIIKDNMLHLWRKLKPKVLRGSIIFGTGDPCTTGEILGIAAIFYAAYGRAVQVVPDFETARFEGNLFVKGRFSLITMVVIWIKILYSGEWNRFRKEAEELKEAF